MEFQILSGLIFAAREFLGCLVGVVGFLADGGHSPLSLRRFRKLRAERGITVQSSKYQYLKTHLSNPNPFIHYFALAPFSL